MRAYRDRALQTNPAMSRNRILIALLAVLVVLAVGVVLQATKAVVLPLVVAWLLSYLLSPAIAVLDRHRVPTALSTALMLFVLLLLCYLGGIFLKARVDAFVEAYPRHYEERFAVMLADLSARWKFSVDPFAGVNWGEQIRAWLVAASGSVLSFITNLLMVMIFLVFLLLGKPYFGYKLRKALSPAMAERVEGMVLSIGSGISRYLYIQFIISSITGLLVWLVLTLVHVDFAVTWGALAFFLNFIPTLGSILASIPPILLAFIQFYPQVWPAVVAASLILVIHQLLGNIIAPKVMGDNLNLSPVVVLLSLIFWGWLWGPVGAILSVPIASAIKIFCENVEPLRPISVMMGSGKAYQREARRREG